MCYEVKRLSPLVFVKQFILASGTGRHGYVQKKEAKFRVIRAQRIRGEINGL